MRNRRKAIPTISAFGPREERATRKARKCIEEIRQALRQFHVVSNFIFEARKRGLTKYLDL